MPQNIAISDLNLEKYAEEITGAQQRSEFLERFVKLLKEKIAGTDKGKPSDFFSIEQEQ